MPSRMPYGRNGDKHPWEVHSHSTPAGLSPYHSRHSLSPLVFMHKAMMPPMEARNCLSGCSITMTVPSSVKSAQCCLSGIELGRFWQRTNARILGQKLKCGSWPNDFPSPSPYMADILHVAPLRKPVFVLPEGHLRRDGVSRSRPSGFEDR